MKLKNNLFYFIIFFSLAFMSKAEIPPGYYDGAKGKIGADLKNALHIIIDGHTPLKYTNSKNKNWFDFKDMDVWEALIYTDEACPVTPNCGNVQLLYLDQVRSYTQANRGKGGGLSWDREHGVLCPSPRNEP